jgi:adenylate kinase family enzyme
MILPSTNIVQSLQLLQQVIRNRLECHFKKEEREPLSIFPPVQIQQDNTPFYDFIIKNKLSIEEYIVLLVALVPHVQPTFFENIIHEFLPQGGDFAEFGGVKGPNQRSILPTGETALFVVAGNELPRRLQIQQVFDPEHFFYKEKVLWLENVKEGEPVMSGRIILSQEYVEWLTLGKISSPAFSEDFPAKRIETKMDWEDLILHPSTKAFIHDILVWMEHHPILAQDPVISRKLRRGYRVLFYGPPGTGKTMTASLVGKQYHKDVYRIDLSQVVSKYIGETEKNLEKVFAKAENKEWILFFDEADALFGKRSNISSAHDKYANQEVSYLLQRIEDFPGLIILASNFKNNIDQAFIRRFNAVVHFPMPDPEERLSIWQKNIPSSISLDSDVRLKSFAHKYELSGSAISNIMQYAALCALANGKVITQKEIEGGIKRELLKEDKMF